MEKIIKIQSENSCVQIFDNFAGTPVPPTQKLLDFTIPRGGVYDLSRSYIAINIEPSITNNPAIDGLVPVNRVISHVRTQATHAASHASKQNVLVKNAQIYSQNRGMIESIRRVDTLSMAKNYLENDQLETNRDLDLLGALQSDVEQNSFDSYYLDEVKVSGVNDTIVNNTSRVIARDHKIPLQSLFGIGRSSAYDGDKYGDTKIHLEMNFDKFDMVIAQGTEATSTVDDMDTVNGTNNGLSLAALTQTRTYEDPQLNSRFFVGEAVTVAGTGSVGNRAITSNVVITACNYNAATKKITYTYSDNVFTATGGGTENFTAITMLGLTTAVPAVKINGAELVLTELKNPQNVPDSHDFITYTTEELNGNGQNPLNRQIKVEPECQTLYICSVDNNQISPDRAITSYRMAIDNVDISGNRDIVYDSNLHYDRLIRAYRNKNVQLKDLRLRLNEQTVVQSNIDIKSNAVIVETMPLGNDEKTVNLELQNAAAIQQVIVYKEVIKTI